MKQIIVMLLALLLVSQGLVAQDATCPAVVETAIESTQAGCSAVNSNELCYGSGDLTVAAGGEIVTMSAIGEISPASAVQSVQSNALDVDSGSLGVAIMRLQAGLTDPAQNVLIALVGDVRLENAVTQPVGALLEVTAGGGLNVRGGPSTNDPVVAGLAAGQIVTADARVAAGDWLRVRLPDGKLGWVFASLVESAGSIDDLTVASDSALPVLSPLQAIHLRTGINSLSCSEALANGVLIQTPVDAGPAQLTINGVALTLDGTFYVEARNELTISALEGTGSVLLGDNPQRLVAGSQVRISLDDTGNGVGDPQTAEPYDETLIAALPLALLDREIEVVPALLPAEIEALTACQIVAETNVNLRGGPGTVYPVLETLPAETVVPVSGQAEGADGFVWWQLDTTAWVRSDVVQTDGKCETVPEVEAPPVPTPAPLLAPETRYYLNACDGGSLTLPAGQIAEFFLGGGGWPQLEEARRNLAGLNGTVTVDGVPLVAGLRTLQWGDNSYGVKVAGIWTATSGTHQISASMSLYGGFSATCTVIVP